MVYGLDNWGNLVGVAGLVITIIGAVISYFAFRRAGKAREAAEAAEAASGETRAAIIRSLTTVDLERAVALVQRLKDLHRSNRWETSLEHYQPLRVMLAEIRSRHRDLAPELRQILDDAILNVTEIENVVTTAVTENKGLDRLRGFDSILNAIQSQLEILSGSIRSQEG